MKRKTLAASLFVALLLSACNLTTGQKSGENSTPTNSGSTASDKDTVLTKAMANLSNLKHSMTTTVDGENYGSIYFTEKGYTETYDGESGGTVYNGQGWFEYTLNQNQIVLEGVVSVNNAANRPYVCGFDIASLGKDIYSVDAQNPKKYTSNDQRLLKIGAELIGLEGKGFDTASLFVGEDSLTYTFALGTRKIEYSFFSFGVSGCTALDRFIANPTRVDAPTSFDRDSQEYLARVMGSDANKLPFPRFASYAFFIDYYIAERQFVMMEASPSKDDIITYEEQLKANGFVEDKSAVKTTYTLPKTGDSSYYYQVECEMLSSSDLNDPTLPYGVFVIKVSRQHVVPTGTSVDASYIASRWNENMEAAGKNDRKVEYNATTKRYSLVGLFGEYDEATEILVTAMADSFLQYMPEEVIAIDAGFGDPADGYEDIIGNGSAYYLFEGTTKNNAVSVSLITCVYSGHLAVLFYISDN